MKFIRPTFERFNNARLYLRGQAPQTKTGRIVKISTFLASFYLFSLFVGGICYSSYSVNGEVSNYQMASSK